MDFDQVAHRFNPLIRGILRSPLHFLLSGKLMVIDVTGRRSGRRYSIPVGYQRVGDRIFVLVSKARRKNWWRNFQAPADVTLRLRGEKVLGVGQVIPDTAPEFRETIAQTLVRLPSLGRQFGIEYDPEAGIDEGQWATLADANVLVAIELGQGDG